MSDEGERVMPDAAMIGELAAEYGIDARSAWQDLGGSWTTNVMIPNRDQLWVGRIHRRFTSRERLDAVQAARSAAAANDLPTAIPVATRMGETIMTLGSGHLAELEPYLPWRDRMNVPDRLRLGFRLLGRLHSVLRTADLPAAAATVRYANHLTSAAAVPAARKGADRIRSWRRPDLTAFAEQVLAHLEHVVAAEQRLADEQRWQIVHGDFWDNNVGFTHGTVTALLDFDFMAERARVDDLALPCYFFLLEPGRGIPTEADRALVRDLADAYNAGNDIPLTEAERLALPLAIARQPAWSIGRWIVELDEPAAIKHAEAAAREFPIAQAVLADLSGWQEELT